MFDNHNFCTTCLGDLKYGRCVWCDLCNGRVCVGYAERCYDLKVVTRVLSIGAFTLELRVCRECWDEG